MPDPSRPKKKDMNEIIGKMNWGQKVRGIYLRYIMCKCQLYVNVASVLPVEVSSQLGQSSVIKS